MRGYDAWLTRDMWAEQADAEADDIIENGMRYFEAGQWYRVDCGHVRWHWPCDYCADLHCAPDCYTRQWEDERMWADENHPRDCECASHDPLDYDPRDYYPYDDNYNWYDPQGEGNG